MDNFVPSGSDKVISARCFCLPSILVQILSESIGKQMFAINAVAPESPSIAARWAEALIEKGVEEPNVLMLAASGGEDNVFVIRQMIAAVFRKMDVVLPNYQKGLATWITGRAQEIVELGGVKLTQQLESILRVIPEQVPPGPLKLIVEIGSELYRYGEPNSMFPDQNALFRASNAVLLRIFHQSKLVVERTDGQSPIECWYEL